MVKLRENLRSAGANLEYNENRIADLVGVSKHSLHGLREKVQGTKSKVYTDRGDVFVMLSERTKKMMEERLELEWLRLLPAYLQREKSIRKESRRTRRS